MIRYSSYLEFAKQNEKNFNLVLRAKTKLKSTSDLSITGQALSEAESLAFEFLNLKNICTDLMFGLSASVLDAKTKIKEVEGSLFRDSKATSAAAKEKLILAEPDYVAAQKTYNDLLDLYEYLTNKSKDFETSYYYYRSLSNNK